MSKALLIMAITFLSTLQIDAATLTIVTTGQTEGLLEACGCEDKEGGLEARAAYLQGYREQHPELALVDIGGYVPHEVNGINKAIGVTTIKAYDLLNYDMAVISTKEINYGYDYLTKLKQNTSVPFISTNLQSSQEAFWKKSLLKEISGLKVGFVAATALIKKKNISSDNFEIMDPTEPILSKVKALRETQNAEIIVLLAYEPPPNVIRWLEKYEGPKIDLIITQDFGILPKKVKDTYIANAPSKGYGAGQFTLEIEKGKGIQNIDYQRVSMDLEKFENEPMREFLTKSYDRMIQELDLQYDGPFPLQTLYPESNKYNAYAGAEFCQDCHMDEYEQWAKTKHAHAFDVLLKENRHWVPKCVMCHVTGYGHKMGYRSFAKTKRFRHVQCETCHGPGQRHADEMGTSAMRREVPKELCVQCHDKENSPDFEDMYDLYRKKIMH